MTTNIDIKALAKEIVKTNSVSTICDYCERDLIGKCEPDIDEYYTIEDGVDDGFLDFDDWSFDIRVTPDVRYDYMGGYDGCDLCDCDHIVDSIRGIDYISVYSVYFYGLDGSERTLDEKQIQELEKELNEIYK